MELQKQNSCCSARRDSETEERKKVLNRCFSTFVHFQTRQSCTLVCICSSFIFYAPLRLSFGRYCSLCEENEINRKGGEMSKQEKQILQVNLCQKLFFFQKVERTFCVQNCSECQKQFLYTKCSPQI